MTHQKIYFFFSITFLLSVHFQPVRAQFPQYHNYTSTTGILDFEIDGNDIWICTQGGLVKLNKSTGTRVHYNGGNYGLTRNDIYRITTDTSGMLFMSGPGFVQTFDKDTTWVYTDTLVAAGNYMPTLGACAADKLGNVYATASNYLLRYNNSQFDTIHLPFQGNCQIASLAVDTLNHVWVASRFCGLAKYDGNTWQVFDSTNSILPNQYAQGICVDHNNKVYAIYYVSPYQGRLFSYANGTWVMEQSGIAILNGNYIEMYADAANNIWMTSETSMLNGIKKYDGTTITSYMAGSFGLPSNEINEFQIDDQGTWFYATDYGFFSYDGMAHRQFELSNSGIPTSMIKKVAIDKNGVKWFASSKGVTRFDGLQWYTYTVANSTLSWDNISDIYADHDQDLIWVTFSPGWGNSGIAYFDGNNWNTITPTVSNGFSNGSAVTRDANGNMWFLGTSGVAKFDYNTWSHFDSNLLNTPTSGHLVADSSGNVYVASYAAGVWQYNGTSWQLYGSNAFPGPITGSIYIYGGPNGQVYAFCGLNNYVFNGTSWNFFNSSCVVQTPNTFSPADASTGELWLSDGDFTSMFNGTSCTEFTVSRLPDLSGFVNSVAKDAHGNYWITYSGHGGVTIYNHDGGIDPETLFSTPTSNASGFVYIDVASDGVFDTLTDIPFANQKVLLLPDSLIRFTNAQGNFNFALDAGTYTIKIIPDSMWQVTTDSVEYTFTISGNDTSGFNFGLMDPNAPVDQMSIDITTGIPRCNTSFPVWINYSNQGLNTQNGKIKCTFDNQLSVNGSSPAADSTDGNSLFWNISGLTTFQNGNIHLSVSLDTFLIVPITHYINAEYIKNGITTSFDSVSFQGLCSYDPNDKAVSPEGVGSLHEITPTQQLDYTIRFQNFGNDTAFFVMILDTLNANLDLNTFRIKNSSHPCQVSLSATGLLTVKFRNINLLWEAVDTAGSQGYFKYSISPNSNIANNAVITNSAAIYFDFNVPVITNEVFNTINYNITSENFPDNKVEVRVYPIPARNEIYLSGMSAKEITSYSIFDIAGKLLSNEVSWKINQPILTTHLQSGIYFLRLKTVSGKLIHVKFLVNQQ